MIPRTLVVTGHFPPRSGGVQTFTWELVRRLTPSRVVVVAPQRPGAAEFDAGLDFPVVRRRGYLLFRDLPEIVRRYRLETGWITAFAPFGLYAPFLRRAGLGRVIASSHGQEIGWMRAWPTRIALRRMAWRVDTLTYLSSTTRDQLAPVVGDGTPMRRLAGGVDARRFRPDEAARRAVRYRYGLRDRPVVASVSRLVRRKGQDTLLRAWPQVLAEVPDAALLIVGDGPMRRPLSAIAERDFPDSVVVTGPVSADQLPGHYAAADLFVLPCRDDRQGLQSEGLGLSALEAAATGLPVVVGRSGGSPASVEPGRTGLVLDATRPEPLAATVAAVLRHPDLGRRMGAAGRQWVDRYWSWEAAADRLVAVLSGWTDDIDPGAEEA
jgi:phosphatidylinositol alpha-1,6-mannosyltransferase